MKILAYRITVVYNIIYNYRIGKTTPVFYAIPLLMSAIFYRFLLHITAALTRYAFHQANVLDRKYKL